MLEHFQDHGADTRLNHRNMVHHIYNLSRDNTSTGTGDRGTGRDEEDRGPKIDLMFFIHQCCF